MKHLSFTAMTWWMLMRFGNNQKERPFNGWMVTYPSSHRTVCVSDSLNDKRKKKPGCNNLMHQTPKTPKFNAQSCSGSKVASVAAAAY